MAEINIAALDGDRALDAIFHSLPLEERKNDGRVSDKWLRRYQHVRDGGGLAFYGIDPLTGYRQGCISFKPTAPLSSDRKYENPPKGKVEAIYPAVTYRVWKLVSDRYGVTMPDSAATADPQAEAKNFWTWVFHNASVPIFITEGAKKCLASMSAGFPSIGLTGIWNGVKAEKDENGKTVAHWLIPSLKHIEGYERTIYIAFDRDAKANAIAQVMNARSVLAKLLIESGCECHSIKWDGELYKGIDDLIAGAGVEELERSIAASEILTGTKPNFKHKIHPNMLAEKIAKEFKNKVIFDGSSKTWRFYKGGVWEALAEEQVEGVFYRRIIQDMPALNSFQYVTNIIRFAKVSLADNTWHEVSSLKYIPFNNGVWSVDDRRLLAHSPDFRLTWKLPRDYSFLTPAWNSIDKFFDTVTRNDAQLKNLLIAACCAVLLGRSDLQKALYLFGSGANGKGTFLRLLEMLVGVENGYSTSLENLCGNRFEVANIYSKRLVICPDEDRRVGGLSVFKSITGGDSLRGEEKGRKAFSFRYNGLVAIASNDPIFVGDNSYGLSRRLIPIPFSHQIPDSERRDLTLEFMADLPAFTTYLLELDRQWVTDTLKQSKSLPSVKKLEWELATRTDSIAAFYDEKIIYDSTASIPAAQLFGEYKQFCTDGGFISKHQNNFCPSLVALCVDKLQQPVTSVKSRTGKIIQGLRLRTILDPICDDCDDCDGSKVNNRIVDLPVTAVTAVTTVTTVTAEKSFSIATDPQSPAKNIPVGDLVKFNDCVEYRLVGDKVELLEIAFHKYSIAREWESQISLWGGNTVKPHLISRNGKKWLLIVKGLPVERLEQILTANLIQSPQQPSRR